MEPLIIFPAIDLKDGKCVRLYQGDMNEAKIFNHSPAEQAKQFQADGFQYLHIVDLDGAFAGKSVNLEAIKAIRAATDMPIQIGGGIRDLKAVQAKIDAGADRVILGTAAVKDPDFVYRACEKFPGKIIVGADARNGMIATEGWAEISDLPAVTLCKKFEDAGVSAIIYTDIGRDGALTGLNLEETEALARSIKIPVIASGGLADYSELHALMKMREVGVIGVIAGKSLYEKKIEPKKALAICKGDEAA